MKWKRFLKIRKTERNNAARQTDEVSGQVQAAGESQDVQTDSKRLFRRMEG